MYDVPRPPIKVESGFSTPTIDVEDPKYGFSIYNQNDAINSKKFEDNHTANFQSEMIHERILSPETTSDTDTYNITSSKTMANEYSVLSPKDEAELQ